MSASNLAFLFLYRFICYHGFPEKLVTNRGSLFVSNFWRSVCSKVKLTCAPSTAYHPQTNGQTERLSQTLEEYLRHFCSYKQSDWAALLPVAELCFNNTLATSTGVAPFFLWKGYYPCVDMLLQAFSVPSANEFVKCLSKTQQAAVSSIKRSQLQHTQYHDKHQWRPQFFLPGDLVLLNCCFIATARPCNELDYWFLGPFLVERMVGDNAVMLRTGMMLGKVHPVFNISLLVPYCLQSSNPHHPLPSVAPALAQLLPSVVDWHKVVAILAYHFSWRSHHSYMLHWKNSSPAENTWVSLSHISTSLASMVHNFHLPTPCLRPFGTAFLWYISFVP
ncbi:hypothetical protein O181_026619 [Austropuccinia psidii MF-1]|uniref:Integrase catalytic domain-containing protein n=1 Tax=Austropuccinia psidii MF-1 TaxID=1389203 RepID=A0A9Q3CML9_9BASI|nr:hypothetical protein [Austropuccinia psidii MF-1]